MNSVSYHSDSGFCTLLIVDRGRKWMTVLGMPEGKAPMSLEKLLLCEERDMKPLEYKGAPYPLKRHLRVLKSAGKRFGITKAARAALNGAT